MPSVRITKELKDETYFVTFTVKNWIHFFDRYDRFEILEKSFIHCQKNKGLKINSFVFMLNHLHFIGSAHDLSEVIRDMKKFLSKEFKKSIQTYEPHLLKYFKQNGKYSFWEPTNYPKLIKSNNFYNQKMEYIQYNPVKKGYVNFPEDWKWSSFSKSPTKIKVDRQ